MDKKVTISLAIAVFNEERNLEKCLNSVSGMVDEIVVVDGGSTDSTVDIAKKFRAKIIRTDNPPIFHINKQKALDACTGDWILQLDADEIIPDVLKNEILDSVANSSGMNGFNIARKNYFWGHYMKKGGVYPDYVIRLVRRGTAKFPCKSVHEQIEVVGNVGKLQHPMEHMTYRTRSDYWKKSDTYTSLTASEIRNSRESKLKLFFSYCIFRPVVTFLSIFIRHKGYVDGITGFEFALYSAMHHQVAFAKSLRPS